jgi:hypothetical protein
LKPLWFLPTLHEIAVNEGLTALQRMRLLNHPGILSNPRRGKSLKAPRVEFD